MGGRRSSRGAGVPSSPPAWILSQDFVPFQLLFPPNGAGGVDRLHTKIFFLCKRACKKKEGALQLRAGRAAISAAWGWENNPACNHPHPSAGLGREAAPSTHPDTGAGFSPLLSFPTAGEGGRGMVRAEPTRLHGKGWIMRKMGLIRGWEVIAHPRPRAWIKAGAAPSQRGAVARRDLWDRSGISKSYIPWCPPMSRGMRGALQPRHHGDGASRPVLCPPGAKPSPWDFPRRC